MILAATVANLHFSSGSLILHDRRTLSAPRVKAVQSVEDSTSVKSLPVLVAGPDDYACYAL